MITLLNRISNYPREMQSVTPDIGTLLGQKFTDSLLPPIKGAPEWDFDGLKEFCKEHSLLSTDSINDALEKLNKE